jgi:hypothetical protein
MSEPEERDLAGEATERDAYLRRLRADISVEEANEECAEVEARALWMEGADLDDGEELLGDPDEYDEHYCICEAAHSTEEIDTNQCDCCGKEIT